jgi:hypothetical protein
MMRASTSSELSKSTNIAGSSSRLANKQERLGRRLSVLVSRSRSAFFETGFRHNWALVLIIRESRRRVAYQPIPLGVSNGTNMLKVDAHATCSKKVVARLRPVRRLKNQTF